MHVTAKHLSPLLIVATACVHAGGPERLHPAPTFGDPVKIEMADVEWVGPLLEVSRDSIVMMDSKEDVRRRIARVDIEALYVRAPIGRAKGIVSGMVVGAAFGSIAALISSGECKGVAVTDTCGVDSGGKAARYIGTGAALGGGVGAFILEWRQAELPTPPGAMR